MDEAAIGRWLDRSRATYVAGLIANGVSQAEASRTATEQEFAEREARARGCVEIGLSVVADNRRGACTNRSAIERHRSGCASRSDHDGRLAIRRTPDPTIREETPTRTE
jgi:hypothetical protein